MTFGAPVDIGPMIAAVQQVPGVAWAEVLDLHALGTREPVTVVGRTARPRPAADPAAGQRPRLPRPRDRDHRAGGVMSTVQEVTYARVRERLLRALARSRPELGTRGTEDFTVAAVDTWALFAEILGFHGARLREESALDLAQHRDSVVELTRLLAHVPVPGLAAVTRLAFTLDDVAGAPTRTVVPVGTSVMSAPRPGQTTGDVRDRRGDRGAACVERPPPADRHAVGRRRRLDGRAVRDDRRARPRRDRDGRAPRRRPSSSGHGGAAGGRLGSRSSPR